MEGEKWGGGSFLKAGGSSFLNEGGGSCLKAGGVELLKAGGVELLNAAGGSLLPGLPSLSGFESVFLLKANTELVSRNDEDFDVLSLSSFESEPLMPLFSENGEECLSLSMVPRSLSAPKAGLATVEFGPINPIGALLIGDDMLCFPETAKSTFGFCCGKFMFVSSPPPSQYELSSEGEGDLSLAPGLDQRETLTLFCKGGLDTLPSGPSQYSSLLEIWELLKSFPTGIPCPLS